MDSGCLADHRRRRRAAAIAHVPCERQSLGKTRLTLPGREVRRKPVLDLDPGALRLELEQLLEVALMPLRREARLESGATLLTEQVHAPEMPVRAPRKTRSAESFTDLVRRPSPASTPGIGCAGG